MSKAETEQKKEVFDILKDLNGLDPLKELFWHRLSYERVNQTLARTDWSETARNALAEDPVLFAGGGKDNDFHILYARLNSDKLLLGQERPVATRLLRDHPYALFVFSNATQDRWHFLNVKYDEKTEKRRLFRRISIGREERLRTAAERVALLDLADIPPDLLGLPPLKIQERHDEAFNVDAVTDKFYKGYKNIFNDLKGDLFRQTKDITWAHDYALQLLNRCMFLYYVQRKRWIGEDTEFLNKFWKSYQNSGQTKDTFFEKWLSVLFFKAFNGDYHGGYKYFPEDIRKALELAPYLNGGLFRENPLDDKHSFVVDDEHFEQAFRFFEGYNFTIAEDSPIDQEVAVDPAMIGKVYETLVNVTDDGEERGDAGIFYTPRTEIDLMCRLALMDNLSNHLGAENKSLLYQLVFAILPEEKEEADRAFTQAKLLSRLDERIKAVTVLDPACGSGSFLVGMLHILNDLMERCDRHLGRKADPYERKKQIIGQSLYGVDVKDWACHVAELRLWLALIVDAEITKEEAHVRKEPLLPHFTFKIRPGDSLVQEVGGINLGHLHEAHELDRTLRPRITRLKNEKLSFYNNDPTCQFKNQNQVETEERRLFRDILDDRHHRVQEEIKALRRKIEGPEGQQIRLDGSVEGRTRQMDLDAAEWQRQIESKTEEAERIKASRTALKPSEPVPFVWDIAFVEIFEGEKEGFDIVIGNPPYVRQEKIADPKIPREKVTPENKKEYKAKLALSVYQAYPHFFGYHTAKDTVTHKIDAKSDLYIYFYFHGLSLLNPQGSFCFITSNSWLDVGYGADLQEFLLKHSHVKMILDNQVKRSFSEADVNTIIALLSAPNDKKVWGLDKTTRFTMFKVPFEHIVSPVIFDEVELTAERRTTPEYRILPINQAILYEEGCEPIEWDKGELGEPTIQEKKSTTGPIIKTTRYIGSKWGGKHLRAPEVLFKLLEFKGWQLLPFAPNLSEIEYGLKTGLTEFFYLTKDKINEWEIEPEFRVPFLTSTHDASNLMPTVKDIATSLFLCGIEKDELKRKRKLGALKYILWGEKQRTTKGARHTIAGIPFPKVPSVRNNRPWYSIRNHRPGDFYMPALVRERYQVISNKECFLASNMFYQGTFHVNIDKELGMAALNSTIVYLFLEIFGRLNIGGRLNFYTPEFRQVHVPNPEILFKSSLKGDIKKIFNSLAKRKTLPLREEIKMPDRNNLDKIILTVLEMPSSVINEVYEWIDLSCTKRLAKEQI